MSKMDSNVQNHSQKYFSNTEEIYDLVQILLKDIYSKEISELAIDLLKNGASPLIEIQKRLKLSFENIKNDLIIMLQNNLIKKVDIKRNDTKFIAYELNLEQILNMLFFPRCLNFIEKKYGEDARLIFEQFMEFGILTLKQIIEQIQNIQNNGNNLEQIKSSVLDIFIKLNNDNLICCTETPSKEENLYKNKKEKKRKEEKKKNLITMKKKQVKIKV